MRKQLIIQEQQISLHEQNFQYCIKNNDLQQALQNIQFITKQVLCKDITSNVIEQLFQLKFLDFLMNLIQEKKYENKYFQIILQSLYIQQAFTYNYKQKYENLVKDKLIPILFEMLNHEDNQFILEKSLWAIGNLIIASQEYKQIIVYQGILKKISEIFSKYQKLDLSLIRQISWVLNLITKKPYPCYGLNPQETSLMVKKLLTNISQILEIAFLLGHVDDDPQQEILIIEIIEQLIKHSPEHLKTLIKLNQVTYLVQKFKNSKRNELIISFLNIASIVSISNDPDVYLVFVKNGILDAFLQLLKHPELRIRKQAAFILSNFASNQLSEYFIEASLIDQLILNSNNDYPQVQKECILTLCYLFYDNEFKQSKKLIKPQILEIFFDNLQKQTDLQLITEILEVILKLLDFAVKFPKDNQVYEFMQQLHSKNVIWTIENLEFHQNQNIITYTVQILKLHQKLQSQ